MLNFGLAELGKAQKAADIERGILFLLFQLYTLKDFNAIKKRDLK